MPTKAKMIPRRSPQPRDTGENDRGATMVEFALIAVVLFTLIFGVIEGAFAVRARSTITNAVDDAARRAAVAGTADNADWLMLQQLLGRGANSFGANIDYVVVFNAENSSSLPSADCKAGRQQPGECNVFMPDAFGAAESTFPNTNGTQWRPAARGAAGEVAFLGVYVRASYEPLLAQPFADIDFDFDAVSVQRIETSGAS